MHGLKWDKPSYKVKRKIPFIPIEAEIDALIASCGPKIAAMLQLIKEAGMRIGEALRLKWVDVDLERRILMLNTSEKGGTPRIFKISGKLAGMISALQRKSDENFNTKFLSAKQSLLNSRKRLAQKLNNPRLARITFHTIRHWKATIGYHRIKDILHVKELLRHKHIDNTMLYVKVERALYNEQSDEFHVRIAKTPEEIKALLE